MADQFGLKFQFETAGAQRFQMAIRGVDNDLQGMKRSTGDAYAAVDKLKKEIEALNAAADLDIAKANSEEYRRALQRAERAAAGLKGETKEAKQATVSLGAGFATSANQALELAQKAIQAARAVREFAMAGVDASRVSQQFTGDIEGLRAATGGAVDDTTLQRLDIAARKTGLWGEELNAFMRLATQFSRDEGKDLNETFQQLIDASPEQLEKWGILTSELVEELKGLDTVQQKQALRQALVNEGMQISNREIAEQTHALERQGAQWDNFVSSLQQTAAAILDSDGVSDALEQATSDIAKATGAIITAIDKWDSLLGKLGETVGVEDVGISSFFEFGWETSVIARIGQAEERYRQFIRLVGEGGTLKTAAAAADMALTAQRGVAVEDLGNFIANLEATSTVPATRNQVSADRTETIFSETTPGFDFTKDEPTRKPRGRRRPKLGDGLGIESFLSGLGPGFGADGSADFLGNIFTADEGGKAIRAIGSQIADGMREAGTEVGTLVQSLDELAQKQAELAKQTEDSLATQIEAYANLGSQGVASVGAWAAAFGASQKEMSYIRFGVESFEAIAAAARYDFFAASQHAAAATGALLVATGAFDGGGSGAGGAARAGGRAAGSGISRSTFGPTANLGAADDMPDRTVIQLQVDGRKLGEEAMRGANKSARTYRRRTTLDARAVNRGMGRSFP